MSDIAWLRIPKKTREADRQSSQSEESLTGSQSDVPIKSRSPRRDKARRSSNHIRLAGQQGGRLVIQARSSGSANDVHRSDYLRTDFLRRIYKIGRNFRIDQPGRLDGYLTVILQSHSLENLQNRTDCWYWPIRLLGRLFNHYITITHTILRKHRKLILNYNKN